MDLHLQILLLSTDFVIVELIELVELLIHFEKIN